MTSKLSRAALVASVEALASALTESRYQEERLRVLNKNLEDEVEAQAADKRSQNSEIARLKSELSTRKAGTIIRRASWSKDWEMIARDGRLAAIDPRGNTFILGTGDLPCTDWEEVDAPTCQPKGGEGK